MKKDKLKPMLAVILLSSLASFGISASADADPWHDQWFSIQIKANVGKNKGIVDAVEIDPNDPKQKKLIPVPDDDNASSLTPSTIKVDSGLNKCYMHLQNVGGGNYELNTYCEVGGNWENTANFPAYSDLLTKLDDGKLVSGLPGVTPLKNGWTSIYLAANNKSARADSPVRVSFQGSVILTPKFNKEKSALVNVKLSSASQGLIYYEDYENTVFATTRGSIKIKYIPDINTVDVDARACQASYDGAGGIPNCER